MRHSNVAVFVPHNGCPQQCSFCNQRTISGFASQPSPSDVAAACEKAMLGGCDGADTQLAFFGGSFTAIDRGYMISLLDAARPYIESGFLNCGIRISTRPDSIDEEVLELLREKGVRAIEIGAQCMDDGVLLLNKRGHTSAQVADAARLIKSFGFELGLQMMTGLYGASRETDVATAKALIALGPETVRIYPTVVLEGTDLAEYMRAGLYVPQTLDEAVELCAGLLRLFGEAGIKVIRLGLHAGEDIEKNMLGGAYHPAFRELCEGEIYFEEARERLRALPTGRYLLAVGVPDVSKAAGQKRKNLTRLARLGYDCRVVADGALAEFEVKVLPRGDK